MMSSENPCKMNQSLNEEAWNILNRDEQLSITLSMGHNKSSWEAGEIMAKSHYKYLEIVARAEKYLRMFTEFLDKHGTIIPEKKPLHFQDFIKLTILERKMVRPSAEIIGLALYLNSGQRALTLEKHMLELQSSRIPMERELFDIILEFDRWNNFRILPKTLQQPSAFKRRNKTIELRHLKSTVDIPAYSVRKIREKFEVEKHHKGYFLAIMSESLPGGFKVIKVDHKAFTVSQLSRLGFFLFENEFQAIALGNKVIAYLYPNVVIGFSPVLKGLKFWTPYRELIQKSINYNKVYNIIPNRKYFEDALTELDLRRTKIAMRNKK